MRAAVAAAAAVLAALLATPVAPAASIVPTSASFELSSTESGSTFECSLDGAPFTACTTPLTIDSIAPGDHVFAVRAIDTAGNVDPTPASYPWTVQ
jgi:large repetitive protein